MKNRFTKKMTLKKSGELWDIIDNKESYQNKAILAAAFELKDRNENTPKLDILIDQLNKSIQEKEKEQEFESNFFLLKMKYLDGPFFYLL